MKHDEQKGGADHERCESDAACGPQDKLIRFSVDGEDYKIREADLTPNHIIKEFGGYEPATNYLVQIQGKERVSYKGQGEIPIVLKDGARFQVICEGPTPVSDGTSNTGVKKFIAGLAALGLKPQQVADKPNNVYFDYEVDSGKYAGKKVLIGLEIPVDFPLSPPGGPHVSPHIHPIGKGKDHPTGSISESNAFAGIGEHPWQYWSRPHLFWGQSKKTVAVYMSHIWKLWDSQ